MPTGYTNCIKDGASFNDFVMMVYVTMRDDPPGTPIPEKFEPSNYHVDKLEELKSLIDMTVEGAESKARQEYRKEKERRAVDISDNINLKKAYQNMLGKVSRWVPPTPEHTGFKDFMIQQISSSIEYASYLDGYYKNKPIVLLTGEEWLKKQKEKNSNDIIYHTKENEKEIQRAEDRTAWIKALRDSLVEAVK